MSIGYMVFGLVLFFTLGFGAGVGWAMRTLRTPADAAEDDG